ncbi:MAG: YebC/PmpR family DNA-binding transcriptional regulator [Mesoaciditoga sp.]|uniref:YebC/PmpR family DNA-binding transcriptional regulator n=1 Tax=Athalassotoga sp. TaxID=2022597 RepID=UPI000CCB7449|nr:MAG: YebC/PmpR family DNA-binding transcriptional regulator [Mesoaciditoga sp.]PMP79980.1 MAG: YebC/PmpR family DNA-binding transcriptional regulator [Mesoaciditoga sp.]HEU24222.1 YebC/PmpR family DNA-binding transcriptional regulator [Mesoaciditoga lauensis]
MSGHNKWANIKHRKEAQDSKKSAEFTKIIRELTVAARSGGGDPDMNPRLRVAIEKAREANMPKDTVERAIKRGTGELEGVNYEEIMYEGYAPAGVALYISTLTDNKNRTIADIRHVLTKYGGSIAEGGSVSWQFERKGVITVSKENVSDPDEFMMKAIDAGAEDIKEDEDTYTIMTQPESLYKVVDALKDEYKIDSYEPTFVSKMNVHVSGKDAEKVLQLINALEELDDVQEVYSNFDIDDKELEEIMSRIG